MGDRLLRRVLTPALVLFVAVGAFPAAGQAIFGTAGDGNLAVLLPSPGTNPVSYTHLTLPTSDLV